MDSLGRYRRRLGGIGAPGKSAQSSTMTIRITIQGKAITATLADSATAHEFAPFFR
jgi:hypothetical protein